MTTRCTTEICSRKENCLRQTQPIVKIQWVSNFDCDNNEHDKFIGNE